MSCVNALSTHMTTQVFRDGKIYQPSLKAVHLIKNKVDLQAGSMLFDFLMSRDYYAKQEMCIRDRQGPQVVAQKSTNRTLPE